MKGCWVRRSSQSQAIVCHIGRSRGAGGVGRGKSRNKLFKVFFFFQAPPSTTLCSSMTQPQRNVGSHGNLFWVLWSEGCRGCYRWSGCGRAGPANALEMVCIFAGYLSDTLFSASFVELCGISWLHPPGAGGTSRTWHRNIRAAFDTASGPAPTKEKVQAGQQNYVSPVCTGLIHKQLPAAHGSSRHFSWY